MAIGTYPVEDLAAYLDAVLDDGIQVYNHAADIGALPAVVMVPGNPAIAIASQANPDMTLAWGIEAMLVVSRSQPKYGTRAIVDLWRQVATAVVAYEHTVTVLSLEEIGELEWSGGEALAGSMPMILTQQEGT